MLVSLVIIENWFNNIILFYFVWISLILGQWSSIPACSTLRPNLVIVSELFLERPWPPSFSNWEVFFSTLFLLSAANGKHEFSCSTLNDLNWFLGDTNFWIVPLDGLLNELFRLNGFLELDPMKSFSEPRETLALFSSSLSMLAPCGGGYLAYWPIFGPRELSPPLDYLS